MKYNIVPLKMEIGYGCGFLTAMGTRFFREHANTLAGITFNLLNFALPSMVPSRLSGTFPLISAITTTCDSAAIFLRFGSVSA